MTPDGPRSLASAHKRARRVYGSGETTGAAAASNRPDSGQFARAGIVRGPFETHPSARWARFNELRHPPHAYAECARR
jgi:hypothetical protein